MNNRAIEILKSNKLKLTKSRLAILNVFSGDCRPINAEYIFSKLKRTKIDIVTIYRTITTFEKKGIIKPVDLRKESVHYELSGHHHHHLVCTDCGEIEKIPNCNIGNLIKKTVKKSKNFSRASNHSFEIFGLCKSCYKN